METSDTQTAPTLPPETPAHARTPLSLAGILWYSLANLGYGAFYAFNNASLSLWLQNYTHNAILLRLMAGTHSFEGTIIQPLVGLASDRSRSRWGKRRPFMLLFIPISALFLLLTPVASHLPPPLRLGAIIACIFLFTMTFNVAADPYQALLADITPLAHRGRVTSFWFFMGALGQVLLLLLPIPLGLKFSMVALLMVGTTFVTCVLTREPPAESVSTPVRSRRHELVESLRGVRTLRQAGIYLVLFFFFGAGVEAVVPSLTIFIKTVTKCSDHQAETMFLILMVATSLGTLPCGWIADRMGFRRLLMISMVLIAVASLNGLWVTTLPEIGVVLGLAGLGLAAQNASAYPLLTSLVPAEEVGFYTGLQTTAASISGPASLFLTGVLINHIGYRVIFAVCGGCLLLSLVAATVLNERLAPKEIAARRQEKA